MNENVLADDFVRAFSCCGGNDSMPQEHTMDCLTRGPARSCSSCGLLFARDNPKCPDPDHRDQKP
jgi:hypothetical protein